MLGLLAALYTLAYLRHPLFPGHAPAELRQGWWSWGDQFEYWKSAAALAHGNLAPESHRYPLGYPALGALFVRVMPVHPFFFPDLALVLGAACLWWRLTLRWLSRIETLLLALAFVATHAHLLADTVVIPWNTLATQCTLLGGIWVALTQAGRRAVLSLAMLAGLTYLVRPIDAVGFAPLLVWATLRLPTWRERSLAGIGGIVLVLLAVALAAIGNHAIFGDWRSPYEANSWRSIGFFSYPALQKVYWLLLDGRPFFGETEPGLLLRYPWLLLAVPGAFYFVRRDGAAAVAALLALGLNWTLYFNYNDFLPSDIYRFTLVHYLVWGFLPLALLAAVACLRGWRDRATQAGFAVAALLALLALGVRLEEQPLPVSGVSPWTLPAARPLLVKFPGVPTEAFTQLRLDGRPLTEYLEFVTPYVPMDLQLLVGTRTAGSALSVAPSSTITAPPEFTRLVWRWRLRPSRLAQLFH